ncbi:MAG: hypothetical protein BAJALOKI1v1_570001 [Promethearchaeota archaeon]|nr:MAG: hypothetical protein BAJALOKI1v1_570001 [Candidatus Lokiarchaeota archaeon]
MDIINNEELSEKNKEILKNILKKISTDELFTILFEDLDPYNYLNESKNIILKEENKKTNLSPQNIEDIFYNHFLLGTKLKKTDYKSFIHKLEKR